jgi:hypothetical protein
MCMAKPPEPKKPPPPPTEREGNLASVHDRQTRAGAAGGTDDTILTGPLGVTSAAPVAKPSLGS